jgi:hypothetical protein
LNEFPTEQFDAWDPLHDTGGADPGILISAQKREISNILKSYTGYYDIFAELIQNALDAVEKRLETDTSVEGHVWIKIDLRNQSVQVTDNGCGMDLQQFRQFLRPNFSFKAGQGTRGSKGVGATYLGYGFNSLHISTRSDGKTYSGRIENGRNWVDDTTGTVQRPMIFQTPVSDGPFVNVDTGTAVTVRLTGNNIRPRDLSWNQATTATQWAALLRILTPAGGIYIAGAKKPVVQIDIIVVDRNGDATENTIDGPTYYYPHLKIPKSGNLDEFIRDQKKRLSGGGDPARIPAKFKGLNGLWREWGTEELLGDRVSDCPIQVRLDGDEKSLARAAGVRIYVYLAFSTDLWDSINDSQLRLRRGGRVLHGGLQLATRHMPQGITLTIPMTNNIGFQNLAHVIIHFDNAEPDLGRKGFQPEYVQIAEKLAVTAVTAFRRRYDLLRKPGVAKIFSDELKVEQWIRQQEQHEHDQPLVITGAGLFLPTEELPIRSEPLVEQDVVALFNQMLSSGLIRGIQLIASSQYNQYDGLFRVRMDPPFGKFIRGDENPLGVDEESFTAQESHITKVKVLEYKYNLDGLIEELEGEVKSINDIGLVIAWEMGEKWQEMFDATCLFDEDNSHHRQIHGTTHSFTHSVSGIHAFEAIILRDLVYFLADPEREVARQREVLGEPC